MGKLAIACSIIIPLSSNAERAYGAYQAASGIYSGARKQGAQSREETSSQSYNWAATQNDLGLIFIAAGQIQNAIACFRAALTVFTPNTFPLAVLKQF